MQNVKITVFTPTYNRCYSIDRVYQSLKKQTFREFEWIVVDDGSTDDTYDYFEKILGEENDFTITYKRVENGGKHRAVNLGAKEAKGELFFIVDSDDYLPVSSLERVWLRALSIPEEEKKSFAGVCGMIGDKDGKMLGQSFEGDYIDATYLETSNYGIFGDKSEVFFTSVIRKYPFPEFEGENFIPESTSWNRMGGDGLKIRYFNEIIYIGEYLPDGLTNMKDKERKYPKAYGLLLQQKINYGKLRKFKKWEAIYAYYNNLKDEKTVKQIADNLNMKAVNLWLRMTGMRLFFKIYS